MKRKLCISALILCLMVCLEACAQGGSSKAEATPSPVPTATPEAVVPAFTGEGTEEDPYRISTAEELKLLSEAVQPWNPQYWEYQNAHYRLEGDIVLNDDADFDNWEMNPPENLWTPIHTIAGSFDGNGHTIAGLYCKGGEECGLFKNIYGRVFDLTLENAFIDGRQETKNGGTLAATVTGTVANCKSSGTVLGGESILDSIGGMVGNNYGTMTDCTFAGKLFSTGSTLGGMAGTGSNFINCHVNGQIVCEEEDGVQVGGIVGGFNASMEDCGIENCTFSGEILSSGHGGGIVGIASASDKEGCKALIRNCTNLGTVTAATDAGGILGYSSQCSSGCEIRLEDCKNQGAVTSLDTAVYASGGILGYASCSVTVVNCVNETDLRGCIVAGILGRTMPKDEDCIRLEKCINRGNIQSEGFNSGGILCSLMGFGENWEVVLDGCVNEGEIHSAHNAGGIAGLAYDAGEEPSTLRITDCVNRGDISSDGNDIVGGILGVNSMRYSTVIVENCRSEGDLIFTKERVLDAATLSGTVFTISRVSGGIVGYAGNYPLLTARISERKMDNMNADNAAMEIRGCTFTGRFVQPEFRYAEDVTEELLKKWEDAGYIVENFYIALEGGVLGSIGDEAGYSVKISDCTYPYAERAIDDSLRLPDRKEG